MDQYRFGYHADLLAQFPTVAAGAAFALGIDNQSNERAAEDLLKAQVETVRAQFASEPLSSHPHISSWRSAFSSFGVKPTQYRCAVEAMLRHVLKKGSVPHINKLVDICNYVSMKHVLPVEASDLSHVSGPIEVRFAKGDEPFLPLYGKEVEYPKAGEVIYTDDEGALSRRWTWRGSDRAKSTPQTRDALLTIEGVNHIEGAAVEAAMQELASLVRQYCGGEVSWSTLDRDHPWAVTGMTLPYLAVAWLSGIYLQSVLSLPAWILWLATPLLVAIIFLWWREWRVRLGASCALLLFLGALRYQAAMPSFNAGTLGYYNGLGKVSLVGVVAEEPDVRDRYLNLKVSASYLEIEGEENQVTGLALVRTAQHPSYAYGDELQIEGRLETPPESEDFSYRDYLARQGVHSMVNFGRITFLSRGHGDPFHRAIYALKGHFQETIGRLFPEPSASLLSGILLGIETGIPRSLLDDFNTTSATHIIAISGFNIAIVGGAIGLLTKRFLGIYRAAVVSLLAIALYTMLVGANAAVVRAAVMGSISLIAVIAGRQTFALASLAAAALLMTLWNPLVLWDVGFQLSFAATLGLVLLVGPMEETIRDWLSGLTSEERATGLVRLLSGPLLVTLAAQLAVWPITLHYFRRLSLVSPVTNFLIIPAQPGVMMVGGLATLLGSIHPLLGQPVAWVAWLFSAYTIGVVELTARIPLASFELGGFSASAMWLYYALFGATILAVNQDRDRVREMWGGLTRGLSTKLLVGGLAVTVILAWIAAVQMPDGRLHVHFLDVDQGDAIFIQCPNGQQILVDGGPSPSVLLSHLGRRMPFWDRSLDLVVLTHPEVDHVGGLVYVLERYEVGLVLDSGQECTNATCESWRALIEEKGIPYRRAEAGMQVTVCGDVLLDILHPPAPLISGTSSDINNNSVVLRLQYDQFSALLTGDVMEEAERVLLLSGQPLHSLALKVPHHGGDTSLTTPFLEAVGPELAIISVGADNRFGHPGEVTLKKLDGMPVYRTDQHGSVEVVTDGARYWVRTGR